VQSWVEARHDSPHYPLLHSLMRTDDKDVLAQALAFLDASCSFASIVKEAHHHKLSMVSMLCSMLAASQVLDDAASSAHDNVSPPRTHAVASTSAAGQDGDVDEVVASFVYSMVWSMGGLLDRGNKTKFSAWVRQAAETGLIHDLSCSGCLPLSRTANLFDYYFDAADKSWKGWSETLRESLMSVTSISLSLPSVTHICHMRQSFAINLSAAHASVCVPSSNLACAFWDLILFL